MIDRKFGWPIRARSAPRCASRTARPVRRELDWQDLRAAMAALTAIASLDQGPGADERMRQIEATQASLKTNGNGRLGAHA